MPVGESLEAGLQVKEFQPCDTPGPANPLPTDQYLLFQIPVHQTSSQLSDVGTKPLD